MKTSLKNKVSQPERARIIARTLGVQVAARYLFKRNWDIEATMFYLAGSGRVASGKAF